MLRQVPDTFTRNQFFALAIVQLVSCITAIAINQFLLMLVPVALVLAYLAVVDFKKIFLLLFFFIPLSFEFYFPNGLATDLPTEPLMILLTLVFIFYVVTKPEELTREFATNPLILLLVVHLFWIGFLLLHTEDFIASLKFFLAKFWYITVFTMLAGILIKNRQQFIPLFWCVFIPLVLVTIKVVIHHSTYGFTFDNVNDSVVPFFRNHVNYAALLTVFLPFVWNARSWYTPNDLRRKAINFGLLVFLSGIFFSYTRAGWLSLILAGISWWLVRRGVLKVAIIGGFAILLAFIIYIWSDNRYLAYSPEFEKTIYHPELADHLEATIGLQDVSSAERVYRWVAAFHMFNDRPLTGYGPGNFYPYYKQYTVVSFETYVSDNEEKSTVHNYFLLMLVEQGIFGFLIFFFLILIIFLKAESIYHATRSPDEKKWVMAVILSLVVILVQIMLSDLLEADKVGPFFFLAIAMLVNQQINNTKSLRQADKITVSDQ